MTMKTIMMMMCVSLMITGCNTFRGMGRDMQSLGGGMKDSARDVRSELNTTSDEPAPNKNAQPQTYRSNHSHYHR